MPAYSSTSPAVAIYPGDRVALVDNAATDSGITKTMRVSLAQQPGTNSKLTLINTTGQTATVQVAAQDADANYVPLSDEGTAITAATNAAVVFDCAGPWVRCSFATAPTTGSLTLCR